jgi:hypothetical protein
LTFNNATSGKTVVNIKRTLIYSLLFFCGSLLASSARATSPSFDCTPVVYAFRHAEDYKTKNELTDVGKAHADLYPAMVTSFEDDFEYNNNYCPVKFVYSVDRTKPTSPLRPGTINPYETARPLAEIVMEGPMPKVPIETIGGKILDEYLNNPPSDPPQCSSVSVPCVTPSELRDELLTKVTSGSSVALFWTSQGLHSLGEAIAPGTNIPEKTDTVSPPRNAAYVFKYNGINGFIVPLKPNQYVQCFNVTNEDKKPQDFPRPIPGAGQPPLDYYCGDGTNGNLPDIEKNDLYLLRGKICDTGRLIPDYNLVGYYGHCLSWD